ncbi:hypothetical protein [Plantactinospora sp. CA-290183]|uniref:hypothetical protein n=1 Tax=Plantactinospora sp. CA-290183 TaxID=3240006 RepID=UPI003D8E4EA1
MVTERINALRRMDDSLGGSDMHDLVRQEPRVTADMARGASYAEATGKLLLAAVGETGPEHVEQVRHLRVGASVPVFGDG